MIRSLALAVLVVVALVFVPSTASAQNYCGYGSFPFLWNGYLGTAMLERPPYFALYPPVYYSYPVARTYGYSPFAYPPGFVTPSQEVVSPVSINNPYVFQTAKSQPRRAPADQVAAVPKPLVIQNPFVNELPSVAAHTSPERQQ